MSGAAEKKKFGISWDTQAPVAAAASLARTSQRDAERTPAELALLQHRSDPFGVLRALIGADPAGARQAVVDADALEAAALAALAHKDGAAHAVMALTRVLPDPRLLDEVDEDDDSELTEEQAEYRRRCEGVLAAAGQAAAVSVWVRGWALEVVRKQRLHRKTHPTLDAFTTDVLGRGYRQTRRWREGYPLALAAMQFLPQAPVPPERNVRELLPAARTHGQEMALEMYAAVVEAAGTNEADVTSDMVAAARKALPSRDDLPGSGDKAKRVVRTAAKRAVRDFVEQTRRRPDRQQRQPVVPAPQQPPAAGEEHPGPGGWSGGWWGVDLEPDLAEAYMGMLEDLASSALQLPAEAGPELGADVLATMVRFMLESDSGVYKAFLAHIADRATATGTRVDDDVLSWSWTSQASPVTAARHRKAWMDEGKPADCGGARPEGAPCEGAAIWQVTRPAPEGGRARPEYWCAQHLPLDAVPMAFVP